MKKNQKEAVFHVTEIVDCDAIGDWGVSTIKREYYKRWNTARWCWLPLKIVARCKPHLSLLVTDCWEAEKMYNRKVQSVLLDFCMGCILIYIICCLAIFTTTCNDDNWIKDSTHILPYATGTSWFWCVRCFGYVEEFWEKRENFQIYAGRGIQYAYCYVAKYPYWCV